jgi:uncharacterized membrane protein
LLAIILGIAFAVIGATVAEEGGFLFGGLFGALLGFALALRTRVEALEHQHRELSQQLKAATIDQKHRFDLVSRQLEAYRSSPIAPPVAPTPDPAPVAVPAADPSLSERESSPPASDLAPAPELAADPLPIAPEQLPPPVVAEPYPAAPLYGAPQPAQPAPPAPLPPVDAALEYARAWLFGGNTVVRVGILVLLVGVALLVRFAAENAVFPIELRMASAAAIGLALVFVGYRVRGARPGFGQTLQGGGIAAMYLVVFFSYRTYELVPSGLAFTLLVGIAVSSGALAVAQDALALIVIGQIGGFMAPVLASSGSGNHIALFSYYLLLNVLTLAVAWVKPWRALNLIGFVFTFGIGTTWGALKYEPEHFASTEPFLIAFFALYTAIPVLYALKRPTPGSAISRAGRGWVDGSLVFGTPLATLLLQYAMVKDMPFAMAYSTFGLAVVYVGLSRLLWKRADSSDSKQQMRSMIEAFLAIGIGFATLAVPYGLDNHNLTGATWALEGAGLYWLGVRQQRWLSRAAGALLPLLGLIAYFYDLRVWGEPSLPLANTVFLAGFLTGLGCLIVARHAHAHRASLPKLESIGLQIYLVLGLGLINAVGMHEIGEHVGEDQRAGFALAWIGLIGLALELAGKRLAWLPARALAILVAPALLWALVIWALQFEDHPLAHAGWLGFPIALAAVALSTRRLPEDLPVARYLHAPALWAFTFTAALEAGFLVADFAYLRQEWAVLAGSIVLAFTVAFTVVRSRRERYPFDRYREVYLGPALGALAMLLLAHSGLMSCTMTGEASPLPFVPLLNPLDLALAACFFGYAQWARELRARSSALTLLDPGMLGVLWPLLALAMFFAWNGLLARSVHHYAGVPFDPDALWHSTPLQVALSISWSVLGLVATALASRRGRRGVWVIGVALLAIVVVKLFTVDLVRLSTVAKIATFLVVGLLLVLVGYVAPVPPPAGEREKAS